MFLNVPKKSMTSIGESETGGWISSFQSRMAGHTVLEDRRNYRDETTEWKLLTRCLPRGTGECLFLCWLQTFLGREREVFKAQTLRKLAPCWEHASLPSPTADAATVHCSLFPFPSPHAGNTRNKKKAHLHTSRGHNTPPKHGEWTQSPQFRLNKQKFRHSLSNLCFCSFCANNHSLQGPVRWRTAHLQSVSTLFSMHQYNFWFTRVRHIYSFAINSNIKRLFLITNSGLVLKGWNQTQRDNPSWAPRRGNLQRYGSKYSGG